jgi:DNA polymerase V
MFAIFDMNAFYASVELIFRPNITNKKVIVLSNNDGAIVACTVEAKACGIKKFAPYFKQVDLIKEHNVTVFSSNYAFYGLVSQRIMNILAEEAPAIEIYSIDEAFIDVTGIDDTKAFANRLKQRVWLEQRIPLGVGIAPTKTLAKLANKAAKVFPSLNGICLLDSPHKWQWLQKRWPVTEVWGIGRGLAKRLNAIDVSMISELASLPPEQARLIGGVVLERTVRELNGHPCFNLELTTPDKQQIVSSRSFGQGTRNIDYIRSAVSSYSTTAADKLRKQSSVAAVLSVWIQTSRHKGPYYFNSAQWIFDPPIDDSRVIAATAVRLIDRIFKNDFLYAKAGVSLSKIQPSSVVQSDLFNKPISNSEVSGITDDINNRFGRSMIRPARQVGKGGEALAMKQHFLSPSYLTKWSDIPIVKC